jgi:hypothetical protein
VAALSGNARSASAASFSPKDLLILGRAVAFLVPPPAPDASIGVVYAPGNHASRQDAEAVDSMIGAGLQAGKVTLRPKLIEAGALATGSFPVVIAAAGANSAQLGAATRLSHTLCATTEIEAVRSAFCTMAITSEPRVEIVVNHTASAAAGIEFAAAFRMMIREIQ